MDSDHKFWLGIWTLVALVIITFFAMIFLNIAGTKRAVIIGMEHGVDPLRTACAVRGDMNSPVCGAIAVSK